ncbi:DMT family transporter [Clostridium magnum]|uniref:Putative inner membrane transporter YicL n=1 Tax=Clostridium magnum DSM 2767 TaxID=1121326 RepID=A0A162SPR8_9CLOT|nr:EamA family transporter [Clostridium magnum]KZL91709.1 putative inner membrane transporter YicL [Clostridium magnum DSM 2767]SHJ39213.1 Threonine/homoserine efflux transporter RhtA [Clostridium magnum DSM 2767]
MDSIDLNDKLMDYDARSIKSKRMAYFFVIIAAILWGTLGIFGKSLNKFGFSPTQIVFIRAVGASITLILFALIKDTKLVRIKLRDSVYFVGTGILSFAFFNWCYFIAINRTSLSVAAILLYTAPTIVMMSSAILFKEKMTKKKIIALVLTFGGCIFVTAFVDGTGRNIAFDGIMAGLGSGFGYALYSIFGRYALEKYDSITVTLYTFIFASIGLITITDIKEIIRLFSNVTALYYAVALGLVATVLPFILYTKGLSYLETSQASIIATLEPIVATIIGVTLYSEPLTLFKILGILLVVLAVFIIREKGKST